MMRLAENTRSLFTELQSQEKVYRGVGEEKRRWDRRGCYKRRKRARLSGTGHGLLHGSLQAELRSLELVTGRVGVLELLQSLGELLLDLGSGTSLDLGSELGGGQVGLDLVQVRLEVRLGLVLAAELLVSGLEPEEHESKIRVSTCATQKCVARIGTHCSASLIIWSISALDNRPTEF
jgi:hypothetical protein